MAKNPKNSPKRGCSTSTHPAQEIFQLILHLLALQTVVPVVLPLIGMRDMRSLFAVRGQTDST